MWPYIIAFSISLWGTYMASAKRSQFALGTLIALLPPILLAAFRDETVGSDTERYVKYMYLAAINNKGDYSVLSNQFEDGDLLYLRCAYFLSFFTNKIWVYHAFFHSLVVVPVYIVAQRWRHIVSPVMVMLIFYVVCYQESLSIVRQSVAMSFSLLALTTFIDGKYLKAGILYFMAIGFHLTGVLPLLFLLFYYLAKRFPIKPYIKYYLLASFLILVTIFQFEKILLFALGYNLLPSRLLIYTSEEGMFDADIGLTNLVVKIVTVIFFVFVLYKSKVESWLTDFFFIIALADLVFSLSGMIVMPLIRLAYYARIVSCISIPYVVSYNKLFLKFEYRAVRFPVLFLFITLLLTFWYYVYIHGNMSDTASYEFSTEIW